MLLAFQDKCLIAKTKPAGFFFLLVPSLNFLPRVVRDALRANSFYRGPTVCFYNGSDLVFFSVSCSLMVECYCCLIHSLSARMCLFFSSLIGAIQRNPNFLCHDSFRGCSGPQSVLNLCLSTHGCSMNTNTRIPFHRLYFISILLFQIKTRYAVIVCRLDLTENHCHCGKSAFNKKNPILSVNIT